MFDWFKNKGKEKFPTWADVPPPDSNVVKFPEPKAVPPMPEVEPPKKKESAKILYRLGVTDNNRVAFQMGYSEVTMNKQGCQQLIDQLTVFMNQLDNNDDDET